MFWTISVALAGVFAASVLRGFTGFGFGLAAVPLLSLALPPAKVVPFVMVLQVVVGIAGIRQAARTCDWRAIAGLFPGGAIGIPLGLAVLTAFAANTVRMAIGLIIAGSVVLLWRGARLPPKPSLWVTMAVGLLGGTISGLSSMGGPPIVVYLLALGHSAIKVRNTSIVYFMMAGAMSSAAMLYRGLIDRDILLWTAIAIPATFAGNRLGTWAFHRAKPHHHRMTALIVLSILAAVLIARASLTD
jgi:uncharacterized membrane protein YfcA